MNDVSVCTTIWPKSMVLKNQTSCLDVNAKKSMTVNCHILTHFCMYMYIKLSRTKVSNIKDI